MCYKLNKEDLNRFYEAVKEMEATIANIKKKFILSMAEELTESEIAEEIGVSHQYVSKVKIASDPNHKKRYGNYKKK